MADPSGDDRHPVTADAPDDASSPDVSRPDAPSPLRALLDEAHEQPWRYDSRWLLRAIDRANHEGDPTSPRLGHSRSPREDPVRLGQSPDLAFSVVAVESCEVPTEARPARIRTRGFGLLGPNGPMPLFLSEHICRQRARGDTAWQGFLDAIEHRLLTLFHRAWAMHQPVVQHDRPDTDRLLHYVLCLCGLGLPSLRERDDLPDESKAYFSGRLVPRVCSPDAIESVLRASFSIDTVVLCFQGEWIDLPESSHLRLGESETTGALGQTTVVGERQWSIQQRFRIRMGPMGLDDYRRLLPEDPSNSFTRLRSWVRLLAGMGMSWDLQLVLRKQDAPPTQLGTGSRLGWTTWIRAAAPEKDLDDLVLEPESFAAGGGNGQ